MSWDALLIGKVVFDTCKNVSGVNLNLYPVRVPQSVDLQSTTAVTYFMMSNTPEDVKDSRSLVDTVRVSISVFGKTYTGVNAISSLIRDALDGLSGEVAGCSVDYFRFQDEGDYYDDQADVFSHTVEYTCRVKNTASENINSSPIIALTVTGDYTWTNAIPAGYMVEYFVFEETTGNTGQISIGTTSSTTNIMQSEAVTGSAITVIDRVNQRMISMSSTTTIYINHAGDGDAWNGMSVNVFGILRKIN